MSYNTKNYTEQGGEKTVIGGTLEISGTLDIKQGATINGLPDPVIPKATNQADSEAETVATLVTDFNALLSKLKIAGLMEADAVQETPVETTSSSGDNNGEGNTENNGQTNEDGSPVDQQTPDLTGGGGGSGTTGNSGQTTDGNETVPEQEETDPTSPDNNNQSNSGGGFVPEPSNHPAPDDPTQVEQEEEVDDQDPTI